MKTIEKEINRLPDPKKSLPNLVIRNWIKERIIELSSKPQTVPIISTIEKLKNSNPDEMIIEPPVIQSEENVKVCVVSRKVGTLWYDAVVRKLSFNEFLEYCFPNKECNSSIYKEEPYTLEELEQLFKSDKSVPVPGFIDVKDSDGKIKKVIIADVLDETTVHREKLLGEYLFEDVKTNIYGFPEDNQPKYPYSSLTDISLAITTIKDSFFKETVELYSVPINIIRSLITEDSKPPVIEDLTVAGDSTIEEVPIRAGDEISYDITNNVILTLSKQPKNSDIVLKSLTDSYGNVIPADKYGFRVLSTDTKEKVNLEINLYNYTRRFFSKDEIGKKLSFKAVIGIANTEQTKEVELKCVWNNKGNTHILRLFNTVDDFKDNDKYSLNMGLMIRGTTQYEKDLIPLKLETKEDLLKPSSITPVLNTLDYTIGKNKDVDTISFLFNKTNNGVFSLSFNDSRIIDSKYLICEDNLEFKTEITNVNYDKENKKLQLYHNFKTKYDEYLEEMNVVVRYDELVMSINDGSATTPSTANVPDGGLNFISLSEDYDGSDKDVKIVISGKAVVGLNQIVYPFTTSFIYNETKKEVFGLSTSSDLVTLDYPSSKFDIDKNIKVKTSKTVELEDLELISLTINNGDLTGKAINITSKVVKEFTKTKEGEFNLSLSVDKYDLPLTFTDGKIEGTFNLRVGIKGSPSEENGTTNINYVTNKIAGSLTPFISTLNYKSLDNIILNIAINGSNGRIKSGLKQTLENELFKQDSSIKYSLLDKNIEYAEDSKSNYSAIVKTKADSFGKTVLTFNDPAFKTMKLDTVDPSSTYTLNKVSDKIENKVLYITFELYKDGNKWNGVDTFNSGNGLKLTIGAKEYILSGSGFNNKPEAAVVTLQFYIGDLTDITYDLKGNPSIGMNNVEIIVNLVNQKVTA